MPCLSHTDFLSGSPCPPHAPKPGAGYPVTPGTDGYEPPESLRYLPP